MASEEFRPGSDLGRPPLNSDAETGASYDPWPNRSPSTPTSADSAGSHQGPFSPPGIDHLHAMDMDGHFGTTSQTTVEDQNHPTSSRQGDRLDPRESQRVQDVDYGGRPDPGLARSSSWAAAHGPNAPRAP